MIFDELMNASYRRAEGFSNKILSPGLPWGYTGISEPFPFDNRRKSAKLNENKISPDGTAFVNIR